MGKIALQLVLNTFHANHPTETMEMMDDELYGLPLFREYGIAATCYTQGIDLLMKHGLYEQMSAPGSLEWGNAPFSHTLLPWAGKAESHREVRDVIGTVPVTFFPEFYPPKPGLIPTKFTLVLSGASVLYSAFTDQLAGSDMSMGQYPDGVHSIRFGGKVGILMRSEWFAPLLSAFFLFQRYPLQGSHPDGRDTLAELIGEVKKVKDGPDRIIVCPLDMEAPWIGSRFGAAVWKMFFEALRKEDLEDVFTTLTPHLERFDVEAISTPQPHRILTKWSSWQMQLDHKERLASLRVEGGDEGTMILKMLAAGSDIYAAWGIKLTEQMIGTKVSFGAIDPTGARIAIPVSFNQSVIDVQLAAYRALRKKTSFLHQLASLETQDHFVDRAMHMAMHTPQFSMQ